jgi:hypothetical protein
VLYLMAVRQCPFCGRLVTADWQQCPYCREALPPMPVVSASIEPRERGKLREGLLCTLLAVVVHYFAGGYSQMSLPYPIQPIVTTYLSPLLLLSGLGLVLHSFLVRFRSGS